MLPGERERMDEWSARGSESWGKECTKLDVEVAIHYFVCAY